MSNIDNLNFEVILKDEVFEAKINKDIELAKQLNVSLTSLLEIKKQVGKIKIESANIQRDAINQEKFRRASLDSAAAQERLEAATINTATAQERLATASHNTAAAQKRSETASTNAATAQERLKQAQMRTEQMTRRITAQVQRQNNAYIQQSRILNELKGYAIGYLSIHGASQLLSSLVRVTGEFELQKTTLAAMLGDLNQAERVVSRIQGLAVESPFQFKELTTYAKQLSAFSVPAQELYDTTKMLADISAGLGVGMDRIVLAYGQVRSAAFLRGQEVRQFTEAGIPILDELAKQFSELEGKAVSAGEVFDKISARLVPFEMVAKVFKDMTSEGGKFYNMQEVQAETLRGKISNLKDAYEVMLNEIGKGQSENLKGAVDWARKLMQNYEETGRVLVELVSAYGVYKTTLIALEVATNSFALANHRLVASLVSAGKYIANNLYMLLAAGITAAGYAIYKNHTELEGYQKIQKTVADTQEDFTKEISKETSKLDGLYAKLKLAKNGTEEYNDAKKAIYTQYASYISELRNEGIEVGDLAAIYDNLRIKIEDATKARTSSKAKQKLTETYDQEIDDYYDSYIDAITKAEKQLNRNKKNNYAAFSEFEKAGIWKFVSGSINLGDIERTAGLERVASLLKNGALDASATLKDLRKQMQSTTAEYNKSLKEIKAAYGEIDVTNPVVTPDIVPRGGDKDDPAERVQKEIDAVRRLRDAYETLAPYMNGDMLRKTLTALFPDADQQLIQSLDFRGKLVELATELYKFDEDASKKLMDAISGEKASDIVAAFKSIETYKKMLDSWLGEDFTLSGEGVAFDVSKIIRDLNNQYSKINQKAIEANALLTKAQMGDAAALEAVREAYGEEMWQKYLIRGKDVIDELANREREVARKTAEDKIRGLSSKYVSEQMKKNNIDLSDFGDKSMAQIQSLIDRMKSIREEAQRNADSALTDVVLGKLDDGQYQKWQMYLAVVEELGVKIKDTEEELDKKSFDNAKKGADAISALGGEVASLGESMDNASLAKFGQEMESLSKSASSMIDALQAKDTVSLITNLVSLVISEIASIITYTTERQRVLNEAASEYRDIMSSIRRESHSGIFGTDEIGLAAENVKILDEAERKYQDTLEKFNEKKRSVVKWSDISVAEKLEGIGKEQGWDLYLSDGQVNIAALEAYYDAYSDRLTNKQKNLVKSLIDEGNAYNDAATQSAEYLTSLFSSVADSISNDMVNAFIESGDAAIDMESVVSDAAKTMASDLIKTMYILPTLKEYASELQAIASNSELTADQKTEKALGVFQTAVEEIEGNKDAINETLQKLDKYFNEPKKGVTDLEEGIRGNTEDQANLIASYINAIRSDVSVMRMLQAKHLPIISEAIPSLMEYQARIEANTFDTAQATQSILSELRRVITTEGGDTAIRTQS